MAGLKKDATYTNGLWDGIVFKKTKAILGGNVTRMVTGSAPISSATLDLMKISMCCPMLEGYG
jgi:long-chain acyl-CoA synthetase